MAVKPTCTTDSMRETGDVEVTWMHEPIRYPSCIVENVACRRMRTSSNDDIAYICRWKQTEVVETSRCRLAFVSNSRVYLRQGREGA